MPPRKDKNKITDGIESSAAASKRRRTEILNGINGVPFTNPITEFPSMHLLRQLNGRNPPQHAAAITDLNLAPPTPYHQQTEDGIVSSLIQNHNFIMNNHINRMLLDVEQFWRRTFTQEVTKRVEMEAKSKEKEQQTDLFRQMYHHYEQKSFHLEEVLRRRAAGEGGSNAAVPPVAVEEEVQSCLFDLNSEQVRMDMVCRNCRSRPATMIWLPCRHLCVCMGCERRLKMCPICSVNKTECFKINIP